MPRVAAIQMQSNDDVEHNLKLTEELIGEARRQDAVLAVLPECFALMASSHEQRLKLAQPGDGGGEIGTFLSGLAARLGIWIIGAGIFTQCEDPNRVRNTTWVFDDQGRRTASYDKIKLFDIVISEHERYAESGFTEPGDNLVIQDTPAGMAGLTVCYDVRFPELYRSLRAKGAIWYAVPSAFAYTTGREHWEILLRARAIENHAYVVAPAQWGTHAGGRRTFGHTMIVEPWGGIIAQQAEDNAVVIGAVDPQRVVDIRNRFHPAKDQ